MLIPVNGGYTAWTGFGACSANCGEGTYTRTRSCTNPSPAFGGDDCTSLGPDTETVSCKVKECPSKLCIFA